MVTGGPAAQPGVIAVAVVGLWIGARLLVDAIVRFARRFGLSDLLIGLTVVAMGTSTPELAVSLDAAFETPGDIVSALARPLAVSGTAPETLARLAAIPVLMIAACGRAVCRPVLRARRSPPPRSAGGCWASSVRSGD